MRSIPGCRALRVAPDFAGAKMNQRNRRSYNVLDRNRQPFWNAAHRREIPAFRRFRRFSPFTLLSPKRFSAVLRSGARNTMRSIICEYTRSCARRAYSRSGRAFAAVAAFAATAATLAKSGATRRLIAMPRPVCNCTITQRLTPYLVNRR